MLFPAAALFATTVLFPATVLFALAVFLGGSRTLSHTLAERFALGVGFGRCHVTHLHGHFEVLVVLLEARLTGSRLATASTATPGCLEAMPESDETFLGFFSTDVARLHFRLEFTLHAGVGLAQIGSLLPTLVRLSHALTHLGQALVGLLPADLARLHGGHDVFLRTRVFLTRVRPLLTTG